ncbi:MAG: hypothetical protein DRI94_00370 [Bacteroidetes bacterium]|nr:MAG: hypothetical protein DRI94_00370 [Bacteroidota bacterium]
MKKILSIFAVLLFTFGLLLTSCNTNSRICPAYPPSVYQGDAGQQNINQDIIHLNENPDL